MKTGIKFHENLFSATPIMTFQNVNNVGSLPTQTLPQVKVTYIIQK